MKLSKSGSLTIITFLCLLFIPISFAFNTSDSKYPLRHIFTNLEFISSEELFNDNHKKLIIDVRSKFEFEILHIKDAINIPISNMSFIPSLTSITDKDFRPIIFYCNGVDCLKSSHAAIKARTHDFLNVKVYDGGVHDWAKTYPKHSVLLGEFMTSRDELISDSLFFKHNLSPRNFMKEIGINTWILDIRDPFQRDIKILENTTYAHSIDKLNSLLSRAKNEKVKLLIYDAVGRQVRWVQYLLEKEGFDNYYFLEGGVKNFVHERDLRMIEE
ncbi:MULTISPECIES: rhodanese-like domain-containing protein [Colwellia]|uniref:Sulfurtransferase n=1 Tax=Colwellia marinimaniae TaxID=1513592 RepID=A0ABQ0MYX7_9GAMM|nr:MULTISPECIES: rhodanese-like domain-containing protein [Colwellia]GAW97572.1 sulfurtransferase [Colwellia marinimaniae]